MMLGTVTGFHDLLDIYPDSFEKPVTVPRFFPVFLYNVLVLKFAPERK